MHINSETLMYNIIKNPSELDNGSNDVSCLSTHQWAMIIRCHPNLIDKCPILDDMTSAPIYAILKEVPDLCSYFDIKKINKLHQSYLLSNNREKFEGLFDLNEFNIDHWQRLVAKQPQYFEQMPCKYLDVDTWYKILKQRPELVRYCNKIQDFRNIDMVRLVIKQPELAKHLPLEKLIKYEWNMIFQRQPSIKDEYINYYVLSELVG